ncbi:MAG: hypothetical protein M3R72_00145 [Bacteroidota bacterium]|nr:hypothetical protein [Bacteroidota bacterium]
MDDKKTNPIDSENKVQQSKDEHIDQDFPGYPHYPAKDDIMNPQNHTERIEANVENLTYNELQKTDKKKVATTPLVPTTNKIENGDDLGIVMGTDADVTAEDLMNLGDKSRDFDQDEDEEIFSDGSASAFGATEETVADLDSQDLRDELDRTGDDLDVSGGDLDDADENIGEEDEENNYYSLGGDRQNNLEDDPASSY